MSASAMMLAVARFACWELALFGAALQLARIVTGRRNGAVEFWLTVLAIEVTLESSIAGLFSFAGVNHVPAYWLVALLCALWLVLDRRRKGEADRAPVEASASQSIRVANLRYGAIAALVVPLVLLSFKPVEEIDSINYLHYMIEWMSNRATPYAFATNYVAFWELSFMPAWMITGVDVFFPLIAMKALMLMALAVWLVAEELGVRRSLLPWIAFDCVAMQHFWFGPSGVPTLKNDALHGVGFVLLTLVVARAAKRQLTRGDIAILGFGAAFGAVKYTGIFEAIVAIGIIATLAWLARRRDPPLPHASLLYGAAALFFLLTSGHYYLHNLFLYGSPFYPFQLNLAFLHLPGTADLSNTSILYSLHDSRLWRALFLPAGGMSPAGLLFPAILASALLVCAARCVKAAIVYLRDRSHPAPLDWTAFFVLCGWMLYFRSVFSASAYAGDLAFILNGLNSIRYVDGVLAVSEVILLVVLARFTWLALPLLGINLVSRLLLLYGKLALFTPLAVCVIAALVLIAFWAFGRRALPAAIACLVILGPLIVEHNRRAWTTYWNDLKPEIGRFSGTGMSGVAFPDGGYFAGHMVAAGSPVDTSVRSLLPEDLDALPADRRPPYLIVLISPGSDAARDWESRYGMAIDRWGYRKLVPGKLGGIYGRSPSSH